MLFVCFWWILDTFSSLKYEFSVTLRNLGKKSRKFTAVVPERILIEIRVFSLCPILLAHLIWPYPIAQKYFLRKIPFFSLKNTKISRKISRKLQAVVPGQISMKIKVFSLCPILFAHLILPYPIAQKYFLRKVPFFSLKT